MGAFNRKSRTQVKSKGLWLLPVMCLMLGTSFSIVPALLLPALAQTPEISLKKKEADRLLKQGNTQFDVNQFEAASQSWQQALKFYREIKDRRGEGNTLGNLGIAYGSLGNYSKAIEFQEQSLAITREIKNRQGEGKALSNLGKAYRSLGNYAKAIEFYGQHLAIAREIKDRKGEGSALWGLGLAHSDLGDYSKAVKYYEQRLAIAREIKDRRGEGNALGSLGITYHNLGNYAKAIEYYAQRLMITREIKDYQSNGRVLGNLGIVYHDLGNYAKAIEYYEQSLVIARETKDREGEGNALGNLGITYRAIGEYEQSIELQEKSLEIAIEIEDKHGKFAIFRELGIIYHILGEYKQSIEYQTQALTIAREIAKQRSESEALGNLGIAYQSLGEHSTALEYYKQSLAIAQSIGDREGEGLTLASIASVLYEIIQPELAILFYKQSVNVRETIRQDIRKLPRDLQESYTQTVAGTYRTLADLLLSQGRVLEAQQVLELLKIQELRDYTRDTRAGGTTNGAPLNPIEGPVIPPFNTLIDLGLKLTTCESQKPYCPDRSQLISQRTQATTTFNQQSDRLRTLARQGQDKDPAQLQQQELTVAAYKIVQAQPNTVLIYPLVLQDKLWLVYGLQAGKQGVVFASKEIPVSRKDLSATVTEFRQLLENPNSDLKKLQQVSQKLYGWLLDPLRPQLDANNIQNLVFSLDRATRYLPIAALHDGKQYLNQRFTLSTILTAGLTDTQNKLSPQLDQNPVLALGLSNATPGFPALPNVANELNAIVKTNQPGSQGLFKGEAKLNTAFTLNAFKDLTDYRILHLATHGKFISEDPEQSFLLLGNGDRLNVKDIQKINDLGAIHLVVLSACETAQGGPDKEGIEVSGLSYYFLTQNAKSVLASLWRVNDASTSQLMQQFYKNLATGKLTKPEALRQAQLSLIQGNTSGKSGDRGGSFIFSTITPDGKSQTIDRNLSHPYYWAPFILIGNGL